MSEAVTVECIAAVGAVLGEGPIWDSRDQALWWVDIKGRKLFRWADGDLSQWDTPMCVGSLLPRASGGFIAGTDAGVVAIDPAADRFEILFHPEADRTTNRFNDGKVDRSGRLWFGTMDDAEKDATGAIYRVGADLVCARLGDGFRVPNGPAFSPDGATMYFNDSALQRTFAFPLHDDGSLGERRLFAQFGDGDGYPDGMTVDCEGCLWIAFWDSWCVRRFSDRGELLTELPMPVARPTSVAFGGASLDRLFITSASIGLSENDRAMQPNAGGLFMTSPGVTGLAERSFAG